MEPSVVVSNVSKSFGKKLVLNNITLNINKGQIYGLIGPSGSGKT
ncbi:glycosyl transferase family 2, partial [Clostridium sp. cpc1]|nr:glycosyl transferase family 2 [Clostridium sp. cpc1]